MEEFIWEEKYRPSTIDECVLSDTNTKVLTEVIAKRQLKTFMFVGKPGTGKTTMALALCNTLDLDYLLINASEDSGIDTLRNEIRNFASSMSLSGKKKVVILDEADYLNPNSTQPALRGFIKEFSSNCTFIFTCNYINRIIEPLHSRCTILTFDLTSAQLNKVAKGFYKRMKTIFKAEGIKYDDKVLAKLIESKMPDWRSIVNDAQSYSLSGELSIDVLSSFGGETIRELIDILKRKDFKSMRKWVGENIGSNESELFRKIYDASSSKMKSSCVPEVIILMGEYLHKCAFSIDKEITVAAFLTELMATAEWL